MTTDMTTTGGGPSAAALRSARFDQARNGYNRDQVHGLLAHAADRVEAIERERGALHEEIGRLRAENEKLRQQGGGEDGSEESRMEVSVRAVSLLSRAQQSADNAVAEAEAYARDLVDTAREQYREILQRAHEMASQTTQGLPAPGSVERGGEPIPEVEYVRTYARVAQVQLRSVLEALTAEVDKLDRLPRPGAEVRPDVSWQPPAGGAAPSVGPDHRLHMGR
ncbi:MAG: DivIVA domain-containing protein [Streptosporangiales bacterium]|nr:DivIVA domain-containing protein [Streptosporangiales bacterium]MBO0891589.1 DivIVA domain-containing protein [Acidothermales bacterium]